MSVAATRLTEHTARLHGSKGEPFGAVLLLRRGAEDVVVGLLPLARLPLRGAVCDFRGRALNVRVSLAEAYGFALLRLFTADEAPDDWTALARSEATLVPLQPRLLPIDNDAVLSIAVGAPAVHVLGRSAANPNELLLDCEVPDGAVLIDEHSAAAALALGGKSALAVTPVWSWLEAPVSSMSLADAQSHLRSKDPTLLLADATREVEAASSLETTRVAIERLELGFGVARDAELVRAYDELRRKERI